MLEKQASAANASKNKLNNVGGPIKVGNADGRL